MQGDWLGATEIKLESWIKLRILTLTGSKYFFVEL
jgi:hypothetical protein